MSRTLFALFACVVIFTAGCNQNTAPKMNDAAKPIVVVIKMSDLASDKDYVCGMKLDEKSVADTASYSGKLYGFCSPECKAEFIKDPATRLSKQI